MSMRKGTMIRIMICLVCVAGIIFCLSRIIPTLLDYRESEKTYEDLEDQIVSVAPDLTDVADDGAAVEEEENTGEAEAPADSPEEEAPLSDSWWFQDVAIDFNALQNKNPELVAWIRFDHPKKIGIDYPVAYSGDNDKYLHTDIYGRSRKAGTLFFEAGIQDPLSDTHKKDMIYGHLMKDGSMFAPLKKYIKDSSVYRNNQYFTVYKPGMAYRYRIFSYFITTAGSEAYLYGFTESDEQYRNHIDYLKSNSEVHDFEPDYEHNVLLLSTCAKANSNQRIVVCGELIDVQPAG